MMTAVMPTGSTFIVSASRTCRSLVLEDGDHAFELGGRRFEVLHTPSAEGTDHVCVWLPDEKILFTGDFFGPLFPMFPNLYTIRGEKFRPPIPYVAALDRLIALEPEMLVPSHFVPIRGRDAIRRDMTKIRDAVQYVHDATVDGMNDGKSVHELMRDVRLPPELALSEAHGKVAWSVRGLWEHYSGFFHFESTAELYDVPPRAVHADLVRLAGGADAIVAAARAHLANGEPVHAIHLLDVVRAAEPDHAGQKRARIEALEQLLVRSGDENHSEVLWLSNRIAHLREELGE